MIFRLLRRDPAVRVLPVMVVGFGALGALTASTALESGPRTSAPDLRDLTVTLLMVSAWAVLNYFAVGKMHEIASPFEMAMPIDARTLWAVRLIGMTTVVCGGIVGFGIGFLLTYDVPLQPHQWTLAFNVTGHVLLMPFLYHSVRIRSPKWGMPLPVYLPLLGILIYGHVRFGMDTVIPGAITLALAAILGVTTYVRLPMCFELPTGARGARVEAFTGRASFDGLDALPVAGRFLAAARALRPPSWFTRSQTRLLLWLVALLNVFALSLSLYALVLVLVLAQFAWFARTVNGGSRLAHLPISRGWVFMHATLPGLLAGCVGVAILVGYVPDLTWARVFASKQVALGVALYSFVWWFTLSLLLAAMATPPATASRWRRRHLARIRHWAALALTALALAFYVSERARMGADGISALRFWEMIDGRPFLGALAAVVPLGPSVLWGLAALCCVAAFLWLRREFFEVEMVPATDF